MYVFSRSRFQSHFTCVLRIIINYYNHARNIHARTLNYAYVQVRIRNVAVIVQA